MKPNKKTEENIKKFSADELALYKIYEEEMIKAESIFCNILSIVNAVAGNAMADAVFQLQKTKHWRMNVKHHANRAKKAYEAAEHKLAKLMNQRQCLFYDYVDIAEETLKGDIMKLYYSLKNLYDKHHVEESSLAASVAAARIMLGYACRNYDDLEHDIDAEIEKRLGNYIMQHPACGISRLMINRGRSQHVGKYFCFLRLGDVLHHWHIVAEAICPDPDECGLNTDPDVLLAMKVIDTRFCDENLVNRIKHKALGMQEPEMQALILKENGY